MRVPCLLNVATIRGRHLFVQELRTVRLLFKGGHYLRVASIQRNMVSKSFVIRFHGALLHLQGSKEETDMN